MAFLAVLGIIPRLVQLTKSVHYVKAYEWAVIAGALTGSWFSLRDTVLSISSFWIIPLGLLCGVFVGMLSAALTEVLNVLPVLAKRIGVDGKIIVLLMALVLGKVLGSLFHWMYLIK